MKTNEAEKGIRVLAATRGVDETLDPLEYALRRARAAHTEQSGRPLVSVFVLRCPIF